MWSKNFKSKSGYSLCPFHGCLLNSCDRGYTPKVGVPKKHKYVHVQFNVFGTWIFFHISVLNKLLLNPNFDLELKNVVSRLFYIIDY